MRDQNRAEPVDFYLGALPAGTQRVRQADVGSTQAGVASYLAPDGTRPVAFAWYTEPKESVFWARVLEEAAPPYLYPSDGLRNGRRFELRISQESGKLWSLLLSNEYHPEVAGGAVPLYRAAWRFTAPAERLAQTEELIRARHGCVFALLPHRPPLDGDGAVFTMQPLLELRVPDAKVIWRR